MMLGRVLFSVFGRGITVKHLLMVVLAAALGYAAYVAYRGVNNHFDHIRDLETQNAALNGRIKVVEGERDKAVEVNRHNQELRRLEGQINDGKEQVAAAERQAATARAATYREIRDAIQNTPSQPVQPGRPAVAPVITSTLDRLWSRPGAAAGSTGSGEGAVDRR